MKYIFPRLFLLCSVLGSIISHFPKSKGGKHDDKPHEETSSPEDVSSSPKDLPSENSSGEALNTKSSSTLGKLFGGSKHAFESLHHKAFDVIEHFGANIKHKVDHQVQIGHQLIETWHRIDQSGKTQVEKIHMLSEVIFEKIMTVLPANSNITPIEEETSSRYICGAQGYVADLKTITKENTKVEQVEDGFIVDFDLVFHELRFNYTVFYVSALKLERSGYLVIKFGENNMHVQVKFVSFAHILQNLIRKECILTVLGVDETKLEFVTSTLSGPKENATRKLASGRLKSYFRHNEEMLRTRFVRQILVKIYKGFTTQHAYACKDESIGERMRALGGTTEDPRVASSPKFIQHCGTELYLFP